MDALVTPSISGHATEKMQRHYSSVGSEEQRRSIAKVIALTKAREQRDREAAAGGAPSGAPSAEVVLPREEAG